MVVVVDSMGNVEGAVIPVNIDTLERGAVPTEMEEYNTNPWAVTTAFLLGSLATLGIMTAAGYKLVMKKD